MGRQQAERPGRAPHVTVLIQSSSKVLDPAVVVPSPSAPQCRASRSACQSGSIETSPIATGIASGRLHLQRRRSETSHDACAIAWVAMGVLMELGVAHPMPPLNAPTVSGQLQHAFWGCAEAGEKGVQGIRLDEQALQIQLAQQLFEHSPLMVSGGTGR